MKKEKFYALYRKSARINLYDKMYTAADGEEKIAIQYISDGASCYVLENLPLFDETNIRGLLGVSTEENFIVEHDTAPDFLIRCLADYDDSDIPIQIQKNEIFGWAIFFTHHDKNGDNYEDIVHFCNPHFLTPLGDETCEYFSREIAEGKRAIVAKEGLITKAVLMPLVPKLETDIVHKLDFIKPVYGELQRLKNIIETEKD